MRLRKSWKVKQILKVVGERADSRSKKKNYSPVACGMKTTFTERQIK